MMTEHEKQAVSMPDLEAAISAARDRVRDIPSSPNLIDAMSEADWNDPDVQEWDITCGSEKGEPQELDDVDAGASCAA